MEMNIGKTKVIGILGHPSPVQIVIDRNNCRMRDISTVW